MVTIFVEHTIPPVFNSESRILILGSIPSPKSRETGFYYGHPQNRFWNVMAKVIGQNVPVTNEEKVDFLLNNKIALWDVLASCEIEGAKDSSIASPRANDMRGVLAYADIRQIFTTGSKAYELYCRLCEPVTQIKAIKLPSTSAANAACSEDKLIEAYSVVLQYI